MTIAPDEQMSIKDERKWPFCQVDNALMRSRELDIYAKAVYVILCGYCNLRTLTTHPCLATIAADLGISVPTVAKAIKSLVQADVLEVVKRRTAGGKQKSNLYVIKDWRNEPVEEPDRCNQVNSDAHVRVKDVASAEALNSLVASETAASSGFNVVNTNDKDLTIVEPGSNDISFLAESQEEVNRGSAENVFPPPETPTTRQPKKVLSLEELIEKYGEENYQVVLKDIEIAYAMPVPHYAKHIREVKSMLVHYTREQIVACWKAMNQRDDKWIELAWVTTTIGDFVKNGNRLPDRRTNGNNGYRKAPRTADLAGVAEIDWLESRGSGRSP